MEDPLGIGRVAFNNLPKDIFFDIFSRIPLKSLYRMRCVCQKWQFFLDLDPEFRGFYHQKHKTSPILLYKNQNTENSSTQLSFHYFDSTQLHQLSTNFPQSITSILNCNGILCLISNSIVLLYDPITKRTSNLPISLNFSSTLSWAFGFSPIRNIFKVLHFYTIEINGSGNYCNAKQVMCEIITVSSSHLGLNSQKLWRFLGYCSYDILGRKDSAYVDGNIYWLIGATKSSTEYIKIMSFNVETEKFGVLCFPATYADISVECLNLVEIKDKLCMTDRLPWESTMNVWMMMEEEEGLANFWVHKYRIDLGVFHHDVKILGHLNKINSNAFESEGEILVKLGALRYGFYELESDVFRKLVEDNMPEWSLQHMVERKILL
ncbi:F-box protein At3g07870-like [Silene latifolia]|uniref:F-box protein At3g07870-like n=1 Tax=Silene latifolia TaxID=37657 RepID=UPI003D76C6BE